MAKWATGPCPSMLPTAAFFSAGVAALSFAGVWSLTQQREIPGETLASLLMVNNWWRLSSAARLADLVLVLRTARVQRVATATAHAVTAMATVTRAVQAGLLQPPAPPRHQPSADQRHQA